MLNIISYSKESNFLNSFIARRNSHDPQIEATVRKILEDVKNDGDIAVKKYCKLYDGVTLKKFNVSQKEMSEATKKTPKKLIKVLEQAAINIERFHQNELEKSFFYEDGDGVLIGQKITPIERALFYVPGGKAVYPSSVLMNAIPAKVAGVKQMILTTPCGKDGKIHPFILSAAEVAGVKQVFKLGGAQAIGAFAYGTSQCPKVDKITGPGNQYVATAKRLVFGEVSIDSVAGPSEIAIIADEKANPTFIALDLFSQAEHDEMASAILITPSRALAKKVQQEIMRLLPSMARQAIISKALANHSAIILVSDLLEAAFVSNELAPEHLEIQIENPIDLLPHLTNAGAIFLGAYSAESVGDYYAGTNHTLPTSGTARFSSALSVKDFSKRISLIAYTQQRLLKTGEDIAYFADSEQLQAHAEAIRIRLKKSVQN